MTDIEFIHQNDLIQEWANLAKQKGIPSHMAQILGRYIATHYPPGDFLAALLSNDLKETYIRADDTNVNLIRNYVQFLYSDAPYQCWGSQDRVREWLSHHE